MAQAEAIQDVVEACNTVDKISRRRSGTPLWLDRRVTLADASLRIRDVQKFDPGDWESLQHYFTAVKVGLHPSRTRFLPRNDEALFFDQLLSSARDEKLHEQIIAVVRDADEKHATALDGVVLQLSRDNTLPIDQLRSIEETYLSARSSFLRQLSWIQPDFATR